uniref:serine/threonine-protein kinase 19-like n=1 Tax=Styela clava TaxID=7725 RepID=UPI0019396080|nr:serine/threonine-protein kinase 19-like [Styela clava]
MSAIEHIRNIFPQEQLQNRFPPIVFKHQLYALLENRTTVDQQVNDLFECGRIKIFHLEHRNEEHMIVLTKDFIAHVNRYHNISSREGRGERKDNRKLTSREQIISRFLIEVIGSISELTITEHTMINQYGFKDKDITELVNAGLLTLRDAGSWWFSIPGAGQFVKIFKKGRQATIRMIRATKSREILLTELRSRKSPASIKLGLTYHTHDLVGSDLIKCIPSTSGLVLRIADD